MPGSSASITSFPGQYPLQRMIWESPSQPESIAFIDARVSDPMALIASIQADLNVILDPERDGVSQISEVLSGQRELTRIDIISHGDSGTLQLGSGSISPHELRGNSSLLRGWQSHLVDDADILIYGCNVASGKSGQAFVNELSALTGADVAASDNLTGSSSRGGDWTLEYATGPIEPANLVSASMLESYDGILQTLFTSQTPAQNKTDGTGADWELGTKFSSGDPGLINSIRYYKAPGETGLHTGKIWASNGSLLASVGFTNESASGWQRQVLPTPLLIEAGATYVVSVNANSYYAITPEGFNATIANGGLIAKVGAGVYNDTIGAFPSQAWNNSNYFRDVDFTSSLSPNLSTTQVIDPNGSVRLMRDTTSNLVSVVSNGVTTPLFFQGAQVKANQFVGWQILAAETIGNNQNQILWKELATGRLHFWSVDSNWNYVSSGAIFDPSSAQGELAQQQFMVDASGTPLTNQPPITSPTNRSGAIAISGIATQNQTLTAQVTDLDGLPATINYQWQQKSISGTTWSAITGATGRTLTLQQAQVGQQVRALASYVDLGGANETLTSTPTAAAVLNVNDPGVVSITGTPSQGQILTATVSDPDGLPATISYQWQQSSNGTTWSAITGATGRTLTLQQAQVGLQMRAIASYMDLLGTNETLASMPTAKIDIVVTPPPSGGALNLPLDPWWGGPSYYKQFSVAAKTEWVSPNFFPIAVFYGKPEHAAQLRKVGINTYMRAENPQQFDSVDIMTREGMYLLLQDGWTPQKVGNNPYVVGWHISEELDMGPGTEAQKIAEQRSLAAERRALNDGRFLQSNFGNGVLGTFWSPNIMDDLISEVDLTSVDKYAYTSAQVRYEYNRTPAWPSNQNPESASAYGWQQDRMELLGSQLNGVPTAQKPNWVFIETAMPFLFGESGAETIRLEEIEGAVWNAIIHGASGIAYFQHNNDNINGTYSLITGQPERIAKVTAINAQVQRMAPVINTQSYVWSFGSGLDTMLKVYNGDAYIFAMNTGGTGARTFTLPTGISGATVQVVDEGRTLTVSNGKFTDTFAAEYDHHIYRVSLN